MPDDRASRTTRSVLPSQSLDAPMPSGVRPARTAFDAADIEAMQLVRSAASIALKAGAIHRAVQDRMQAAVVRVSEIIQREAARGQ